MTRISLFLTVLLVGLAAPAMAQQPTPGNPGGLPTAQEWRRLSSDVNGGMFYDARSLSRTTEGLIAVTTRNVFLQGEDVHWRESQWLFDCRSPGWFQVQHIRGTGRAAGTDDEGWRHYSDPTSPAAKTFAIACRQGAGTP